jgi:DNA helicase-2/ATP-dependent DNA helicase PcrA
MSANRLFIAAAGSGKTKLIVDEVKKNEIDRILITTFTLANEKSIYEKLIKGNNGCVPLNVTIQTWFSFLVEHGVRPYRFWPDRVIGMKFVSSASGVKYTFKKGKKDIPVCWGEDENFLKYYFNSAMDVYSDKLAKLVFRCNEKSDGYVVKRLEQIYDHIYIDEVQDMAGWDLELIKLFMKSSIALTMVGDPRQTVYLTHHDRMNPEYKYGKIKNFVLDKCPKNSCPIDEETLKNSHRNTKAICELSSRLFQDLPVCISDLSKTNAHMGIYFVLQKDVKEYYAHFKPMQLRWNKLRKLYVEAPCMTFGESKGLEFNHILIYPTEDMLKWLCGQKITFEGETRSKLYVALTRAFFSVGIVVKGDFKKTVNGISIWRNI